MKALLACWLTAIAALVWLAVPHQTTFKQRWAPATEHPLHSVSAVRAGFCYPAKCLNG
jgi:hypothetical protein